jgi:hypothetical protein
MLLCMEKKQDTSEYSNFWNGLDFLNVDGS